MPKTLFKDYVTKDGEERIRNYKYKCTTDSFMYTYVMGPLANFSLKFVPETVAPNTLTFLAFLFNVIPHLLILWYTGDDLSVEIPRWLCILTGLSQFMYMNLDNMDGKQARRTGSSSSLGMLYDHGLDSLNGWIMGLNLAAIIRVGNGNLTFWVLSWSALAGFYFTMYEEYHLEVLNFGYVNPVDEGLSFMNLLIIFTGIVGSEWWLEEALFGYARNTSIIALTLGIGTFGVLINIFNVYKKEKDLQKTFEEIKVPLFLVACIALVSIFTPTDIVTRRTRSLISCFGLGFSKVIGHIQLAHCAGDTFYQWRRSFIWTSLIIVGNTISSVALGGKCLISEDILLNIMIPVNAWFYIHYLLSITQQLTRVLDIKVFSIKKEKAKSN
jgi:ethanolaminephosphotransferase